MLKQWQRRRRFEQIIRPHSESLRRFAHKLEHHPDDAEDLLQETLLLGLTRLDQLRHDGAARVWISRVMYRCFLNRRRRHANTTVEPWSERAEHNVLAFPRADQHLSDQQLGQRINRAIAALPSGQQEAIWLVDGQGFTFAEAADILAVRPGTVASRVARARAVLRQDLADMARERGLLS